MCACRPATSVGLGLCLMLLDYSTMRSVDRRTWCANRCQMLSDMNAATSLQFDHISVRNDRFSLTGIVATGEWPSRGVTQHTASDSLRSPRLTSNRGHPRAGAIAIPKDEETDGESVADFEENCREGLDAADGLYYCCITVIVLCSSFPVRSAHSETHYAACFESQ